MSMDFEVTRYDYLLIIYSVFVKYLRQMGTQRSSASAILSFHVNVGFIMREILYSSVIVLSK
jgi:hypothetical protein